MKYFFLLFKEQYIRLKTEGKNFSFFFPFCLSRASPEKRVNMSTYNLVSEDTYVQLRREDYRVGSIFLLAALPFVSLFVFVVMLTNKLHFLLILFAMVCGGALLVPLLFVIIATIKIKEVLQADEKGVVFRKESAWVPAKFSAFIPLFGEQVFSYDEVKQCKIIKSTEERVFTARERRNASSIRRPTMRDRTVTTHYFSFVLQNRAKSPYYHTIIGYGQEPDELEAVQFVEAFQRFRERYGET